jgi:hypothetical protein
MFSSIAYKKLPKDEQQDLAEEQGVIETGSAVRVRQIFLNAFFLGVILLASNSATWFVSKRLSITSHETDISSLDIPTVFGMRKSKAQSFHHILLFD